MRTATWRALVRPYALPTVFVIAATALTFLLYRLVTGDFPLALMALPLVLPLLAIAGYVFSPPRSWVVPVALAALTLITSRLLDAVGVVDLGGDDQSVLQASVEALVIAAIYVPPMTLLVWLGREYGLGRPSRSTRGSGPRAPAA